LPSRRRKGHGSKRAFLPRPVVSDPAPASEAPGALADDVIEPDLSAFLLTRPAFLSPKQFAVVVGISEKTVLRRIQDGLIRATRIGRLWRIPVTEVGRRLG
jgi:excisionase family DNA binding protein